MKFYSVKVILKKNLVFNYKALQDISNSNICSVIKANAYGHDAVKVCKILSPYCGFFAVQNLQEAIQIRKINNSAIILVLGYCIDYNLAVKNNISVTIDSLKEINKIIKINKKIKIHLKINSGMNRLGINNYAEFKEIINIIKNNKNIILEGVFTHCFCSKNKKITNYQINIFKYYINILKNNNLFPIIHIGGSGLINYKLNFVHYIRCGISLFGYLNKFVKPVMVIKSRVLKVYTVNKGEYVGYDCYYKTNKKIKVAIIPLGYADGIRLKNKYVKYKDQKLKIIGKICMDMFMVDVTKTNIKDGDFVTVFDSAKEWANKNSLSEYQILTGLNNARCDIVVK